jgi:hypothetical protein
MVIFKNQHGGKGPQSLDEFNSVISAAKGELGKGGKTGASVQQERLIADKKNSAIEKATRDFAGAIGDKEALGEYQSALQEAQNAYEEDSALLAGGNPGPHQVVNVDKNGQVTWAPQAAAPLPAVQPNTPAVPPGGPIVAPAVAPRGLPPATNLPDGTTATGKKGEQFIVRGGQWQPAK